MQTDGNARWSCKFIDDENTIKLFNVNIKKSTELEQIPESRNERIPGCRKIAKYLRNEWKDHDILIRQQFDVASKIKFNY